MTYRALSNSSSSLAIIRESVTVHVKVEGIVDLPVFLIPLKGTHKTLRGFHRRAEVTSGEEFKDHARGYLFILLAKCLAIHIHCEEPLLTPKLQREVALGEKKISYLFPQQHLT